MSALLVPGDIISLSGDLGSGKTTLVKGIYLGLGGQRTDPVRSPTFTLINEYQGAVPIYHFDFYRLKDYSELEDLGVEEYFYGEGISLVEWGERFPEYLGDDYLSVRMSWVSENERELAFEGASQRCQTIIAGLTEALSQQSLNHDKHRDSPN